MSNSSGWHNYHELFFEDETFGKSLTNNFVWLAFFLTIPFILALFCASLAGTDKARRHGLSQHPLHPIRPGQRRHHRHLAQPA